MTPNEPANGWTIPTAMAHLTALLDGYQGRTEDRIAALRELIDERDKRAPTRDEIREQFRTIEADIASLRETRTAAQGEKANAHTTRTRVLEGWGFVVGALGILFALWKVLNP